MATLHLGVLDVAYSDASGNGATTTFQVAQILEANYHIMETFFELYKDKIAGFLADSVANAIQDLVNGNAHSPTFDAEQQIEALFRQFIFSNQMSHIFQALSGAPLSAAAEAGVSHRKKHPYAKANPSRPAFVDTGTFLASFKVWLTSDSGAKV